MHRIRKNKLPAAVVLDPDVSLNVAMLRPAGCGPRQSGFNADLPQHKEYYDMTIEGSKIAFDGASVFSVLEGVYQHFLRPKKVETTLEWGSRSATMTLIGWVVSLHHQACHPGVHADLLQELAVDHPFAAVLSLVGGVGLFVFLLQKCYAKNPRPRDSEKSAGLRLD